MSLLTHHTDGCALIKKKVKLFCLSLLWNKKYKNSYPVRYEKDVQLFKSKVVDSVKLCNSHLFDQPKIDDPYAIRLDTCCHFWHFSAQQYKKTRSEMLHVYVKTKKLKRKQRSMPPFTQLFGFSFSPWNPAVHDEVKEKMFIQKVSRVSVLVLGRMVQFSSFG